MDFPDISLVLQVGLPLNSDAYTHRVGRTARAGKSGRAIIMLTEAESFYLKSNRQFPITPYPASKQIANDSTSEPMVQQAMQIIDDKTKQKAYSAYIGFMRGFESKMRINSAQLVQMANQFAMKGMGCPEPPGMDKKTVGFVSNPFQGNGLLTMYPVARKMGLKGVPGIRYIKPQSNKTVDDSYGNSASYSSALNKRPG